MPETETIASLAGDSPRNAFAVLVYLGRFASWNGAANVVVGAQRIEAPRIIVTSPDGASHDEMTTQDFFRTSHVEQQLTISADWYPARAASTDALDGYVVGTFDRTRAELVEYFEFGTLKQFEPLFLELVLERFLSLDESGAEVLFAVDGASDSTAQDWVEIFRGMREVPSTATLVAAKPGRLPMCPQHLVLSTRIGAFEVYARHADT